MALADPNEPMYHHDGDWLAPTNLARGPWFDDSQHGGAIAAILTRAAERVPTAQHMRFTRMSIELFRTVPRQPVRTEVEIVRDGKRIQSVDVRLFVRGDDRLFARGSFGRIRVAPGLLDNEDLELHEAAVPVRGEPRPLGFLSESNQLNERFAYATMFDTYGDHVSTTVDPDADYSIWWRLQNALVAGEQNSPAVRLAAIADMAASAGRVLSHENYLSPNSDLSVLVAHEPRSEWLCLGSTIRLADDGIGQTDALISDDEGAIGRAVKSLLVDRR